MRKPVFALYEQQRRRSDCAFTQSDQHLCCSLLRKYNTCSCYVPNFKNLASLCSWAGRCVSYLVAIPENEDQIKYCHYVVSIKFPFFWMDFLKNEKLYSNTCTECNCNVLPCEIAGDKQSSWNCLLIWIMHVVKQIYLFSYKVAWLFRPAKYSPLASITIIHRMDNVGILMRG